MLRKALLHLLVAAKRPVLGSFNLVYLISAQRDTVILQVKFERAFKFGKGKETLVSVQVSLRSFCHNISSIDSALPDFRSLTPAFDFPAACYCFSLIPDL